MDAEKLNPPAYPEAPVDAEEMSSKRTSDADAWEVVGSAGDAGNSAEVESREKSDVPHESCPVCKLLAVRLIHLNLLRQVVASPEAMIPKGSGLYPPRPHPMWRTEMRKDGEDESVFYERWYWEWLAPLVQRQPDLLPSGTTLDDYKQFHQSDVDRWKEEVRGLPALVFTRRRWRWVKKPFRAPRGLKGLGGSTVTLAAFRYVG